MINNIYMNIKCYIISQIGPIRHMIGHTVSTIVRYIILIHICNCFIGNIDKTLVKYIIYY